MLLRSKPARSLFLLCCLLLAAVVPGNAHIGSPDTYVRAAAGPYNLLVAVHPPAALPGFGVVEVRAIDSGVNSVTITLAGEKPQSLSGINSQQVFSGSVWVSKKASVGGWNIVVHVSGVHGDAEVTVPVPATNDLPLKFAGLKSMRLRWSLAALGLACIVLIVRHRSRALKIAAAVVVIAVFVEALYFAFTPIAAPRRKMQLALEPGGKLDITLPGKFPDIVKDNGYLMHLFAVSQPHMDVLLHLNPAETSPGHFTTELPPMPAGSFTFYADIVHTDGRLNTFTTSLNVPAQPGQPPQNDDTVSTVPGVDHAPEFSGPGSTTVELADGYHMTLDLASALRARDGELLGFTLLDPTGKRPADMQLYMGMSAHAIVVKTDGSVFVALHPTGTISMAAYGTNPTPMETTATNQVSFPYGFPTAGAYRIFVQMKHGTTVETAAFDLLVH
jgi:hypothetical protein